MAGHGIKTQLNPTSATTEQFTDGTIGTVKGFFIYHSNITTINTDEDGFGQSTGHCDLSSSSLKCFQSENNVAQGNSYTDNDASTLARTITDASVSVVEEAVYDQLVSNGVQIDWTTGTSTQYASSVAMFAEGIEEYWSDYVAFDATITCGFQADLVIVTSGGTLGESTYADGRHSLCYYDRASDTMRQWLIFCDDQTATGIPDSACISENVNELHGAINLVGNPYNDFAIDTFTGTGFDIDLVANSNISGHVTAIKFAAGYDFEIGFFTAPTSTGETEVISGLGFTPQLLMLSGTSATSLNTPTDDARWFEGGTNGSNQFAMGAVHWQTTSTANTRVAGWHHDDACIYLTDDDGDVVECEATISGVTGGAFGADSVTLDFTTAATAFQIMYLVIGKASSDSGLLLTQSSSGGF